MILPLVISVLIGTAWLAALIFIARFLYTLWFRRTAGLITMSFLVTVFSLLCLALTNTVLGQDWPGRDWVRMVIFAAVNVLLWSCVVLLVRDQHRGTLK
jgi:hypothetical protein